jgi:threonine/homoserine/homoserine lactone efflux protein
VKVGLFWTALAPQFLGGGLGPAMVVTAAVLAFVWLSGYALLAGRLRLDSRFVNRSAGAAMVVLAVWLLV